MGFEVWRKGKYSSSILVAKDFGGAMLTRDLIKWKQSTIAGGVGVIHPWSAKISEDWHPAAGITVRW